MHSPPHNQQPSPFLFHTPQKLSQSPTITQKPPAFTAAHPTATTTPPAAASAWGRRSGGQLFGASPTTAHLQPVQTPMLSPASPQPSADGSPKPATPSASTFTPYVPHPSALTQPIKPHLRRGFPSLVHGSRSSQIDQPFIALLSTLIPSSSSDASRDACRAQLEALVRCVWPTAAVRLFGSSVNLLCDEHSDCDLSLLMGEETGVKQSCYNSFIPKPKKERAKKGKDKADTNGSAPAVVDNEQQSEETVGTAQGAAEPDAAQQLQQPAGSEDGSEVKPPSSPQSNAKQSSSLTVDMLPTLTLNNPAHLQQLALTRTSTSDDQQPIEPGAVIEKLAAILKTESATLYSGILALPKARVPIVKFHSDEYGYDCDIGVNNLLAIENSQLIRAYMTADTRARQLVFIVKHWAKQRKINDPFRGTLSSYAYVLMTIHYLQQLSPPVLPCLQSYSLRGRGERIVGGYDCWWDQRLAAEWRSDNGSGLSALLSGWYMYYAHCFPAVDTRVLTNRGLLFLDEIEQLLADGVEVLYGSYDVASKALQYSKGKLVYSASPHEWVAFTQPGEAARWVDVKDRMLEADAQSGHVSLRVTPGHNMFVQTGEMQADGRQVQWSSREQSHSTVKAESLLSECSCPAAQPVAPDCVHRRAHIRMLACAEAGYVPASTSQRQAVQRSLSLDDPQFSAFLNLLGFWLADGSMAHRCDAGGRPAVIFSAGAQTDAAWLRDMLQQTGLCRDSWTSVAGSGEQLCITDPAWCAHFIAEFGSKHVSSRHHQTQASHTGSLSSTPPSTSSCLSLQDDDGGEVSVHEEEMRDDEQLHETTKSVKQLPDWALLELSRDEMRPLIAGLHRAAGTFTAGSRVIRTASACLRDQLMQALLHCGYSAYSGRSTAGKWQVSWSEVGSGGSSMAACCPSMTRQQCVSRVPYCAADGRTWCVEVEHTDHLIIAQRAQRNADGAVTQQSRPIIVGNCFGYSDDVISVRVGGVLGKREKEKEWAGSGKRDKHLLSIEDPFEVSHDLGRVCDGNALFEIRGEMIRGTKMMLEGKSVQSIVAKYEKEWRGS